jgi:hypothetical protein
VYARERRPNKASCDQSSDTEHQAAAQVLQDPRYFMVCTCGIGMSSPSHPLDIRSCMRSSRRGKHRRMSSPASVYAHLQRVRDISGH